MASYADFDNFIDHEYNISKFLERFFADAYCMANTYEGLIFYYGFGVPEKIMVKDLEKVLIGSDHIYFKFKKKYLVFGENGSPPKMDVVIPFESIKKIQILPPNPGRWG